MTNETIKILLMVMLFGGLRTAMFVTDVMPKWWPWLVQHRRAFLHWMAALLWQAMLQPAKLRRPLPQ